MKNYLSNAQSEKWAAYVYLAYAAFKLDWKDLACLELEQAGNVANDYPKIKAEIDAHCKQYQGQHSFDYWFEKEKEADKKGNYELALFFGKKAVVLKPNHGQANLYLGDALYRSSTNKDIQKSIDHLKIAMNHVSGVELSRAYHGLAKAYHEQKKYDSSANYYKLAIENALKHPYPFDQNYKLQHFYSMRGLILVELYGKNDPEGCRCLKAAIKYEDQPSLRKYRVEDYQRYCPNVVSSTPATTTPSTTPSTSYTPSSSPCSDPNADHGYKKEYYDGYLYMEGEYECGKKTGEWKQYDLDGNLHYRWIFKNDEKVEFIRYFKGSSKIEAIWNPRDGAIWYDINGNVVDTDQY